MAETSHPATWPEEVSALVALTPAVNLAPSVEGAPRAEIPYAYRATVEARIDRYSANPKPAEPLGAPAVPLGGAKHVERVSDAEPVSGADRNMPSQPQWLTRHV